MTIEEKAAKALPTIAAHCPKCRRRYGYVTKSGYCEGDDKDGRECNERLVELVERPAVVALLREERAETWRKAQDVAALWSVKPDRSLHPDIPWEQMNEASQTAAHSAAQQIAFAIEAEARAEAER